VNEILEKIGITFAPNVCMLLPDSLKNNNRRLNAVKEFNTFIRNINVLDNRGKPCWRLMGNHESIRKAICASFCPLAGAGIKFKIRKNITTTTSYFFVF